MNEEFDDIMRLLETPVDLGRLGFDDDYAAAAPAPVDHDGGGASTSAATTSAAPAPQEDTLGCAGRCYVLREVVHSKGLEMTKLSIHGNMGVFYHAILDVYRVNAEVLAPVLVDHSIIDFVGRGYTYKRVNQYLTGYAMRRASGGFTVVHDFYSDFFDVLRTPMDCTSQCNDAHKIASSQSISAEAAEAAEARTNGNGDDNKLVVHAGAVVQPVGASGPSQATNHQVQQPFQFSAKSALAIQREKTRKLQLGDIAPYFDLPIAKAASKLGVCGTALKGICRKHGVPRWPYRKVRSIDRQIATLRRSGNEDATREEIDRLSSSRRRVVNGLE